MPTTLRNTRVAASSCESHVRTRASCVRMNWFEKLMKDIDNFADDAVGRRLGNGADFYGKRKSSFYGDEDAKRKADPNAFDAEEDYRGPAGGSYFVLSKERDEKGRPMAFLTRQQAREEKAREEEERWKAAKSQEQVLSSFSDAVRGQQEEEGI